MHAPGIGVSYISTCALGHIHALAVRQIGVIWKNAPLTSIAASSPHRYCVRTRRGADRLRRDDDEAAHNTRAALQPSLGNLREGETHRPDQSGGHLRPRHIFAQGLDIEHLSVLLCH